MLRLPHVASRVLNVPLLIHPGKLDAILAGLAPRLGLGELPPVPQAYTTATGEKREARYRVVGNVGVIDLFGVLVHRSRMEADSSFLLGYQEVARRFEAALADREVASIVLNIDSPGGEVAGAFDLVEQIRSARGQKPIAAVAGDLAASAAYAIASAADEISVTRTGAVGSIGVVMRHVDYSRFLDKEGVSVSHIFAGARKVDGNPYEPLPEDVRARFQGEIDRLYGLFVDTVAANRGLEAQAVRETEADIFMGERAVQAGLADRVETPDQLISRLAARYGRAASPPVAGHQPQETAMSTENKPAPAAGQQPEATFTQADLDAARAEGREEGERKGLAAGTERVRGILTHAEAEGREAQARALALDTDLDAEAAGKVLAASPKVKAGGGAGATAFERHMETLGNPEVGADVSRETDDVSATVQRVMNA